MKPSAAPNLPKMDYTTSIPCANLTHWGMTQSAIFKWLLLLVYKNIKSQNQSVHYLDVSVCVWRGLQSFFCADTALEWTNDGDIVTMLSISYSTSVN